MDHTRLRPNLAELLQIGATQADKNEVGKHSFRQKLQQKKLMGKRSLPKCTTMNLKNVVLPKVNKKMECLCKM